MTQRKVRARARYGSADETLGSSGGKERICLTFDLSPGHQERYDSVTWFGFLTDAAIDFTLTALRNCGWEGEFINDLTGVDRNEVELVLEDETYEGKTRTKVKFVNRVFSGFDNSKAALGASKSQELAARLRAKAALHRQTYRTQVGKTLGNGAADGGFDSPPPTDNDMPLF